MSGIEVLTPREVQVLTILATGKQAKEVAVQLDIAARTVEQHRENIYNKLGVRKRTELPYHAERFGLLKFKSAITIYAMDLDKMDNCTIQFRKGDDVLAVTPAELWERLKAK